MRSPTFTLGGTATLRRLYQKNFHTPKMYLTRLNVYKLQLSTSNNFRDMRGSQLYTRGAALWNTPSGKIVISKKCTWPYL